MSLPSQKLLGIIGGVGPLATLYFMQVLTQMTDAKTDQEHLDSIILNHCSIPDRTAYILDHSKPNPATVMIADAQKLEALGAGIIATPCNTAHTFFDALQAAVHVPVIHMIDETAKLLKQQGAKRVGIMATTGTIQSGLFQSALARHDVESVIPSPSSQAQVMQIIYDQVKANQPVSMDTFYQISDTLVHAQCDRIILGCTELSIVKRDHILSAAYIDSLEVLAMTCVRECGYPVKL